MTENHYFEIVSIFETKVPYFFFRGHGRRPFIHPNPKIVFFFPKTGRFFVFSRKFPANFLFFFLLAEKFVGHSFIRFQNCFFFSRRRKKKTAFSFIHSIFLLKCTKTNFSGEKKTVPLFETNIEVEFVFPINF